MLRWVQNTWLGYKTVDGEEVPIQLRVGYCMSDDEKPVGGRLANGSRLIEIDTGEVYFYDEGGEQWYAI